MDNCASCEERPAASWVTRHVGVLAARTEPLCRVCAAALSAAPPAPEADADADAWLRALGPLDLAYLERQLPSVEASAGPSDLAASAAALARAAALHAQVLTPPLRAFVARHA